MSHSAVNQAWEKFFSIRTKKLHERYPGCYRALVIETNDPLNIGRVRFKCPDMHDFDLPPEACPWAVPAPNMGGPHAAQFGSPCIGDEIWITFERQHPYGPVWIGFADPTRRRAYAFPQISQPTAISLDDVGRPVPPITDYNSSYLPQDGRPMSYGVVDRYGNIDLQSSVGFFPSQHNTVPPPADHDYVQGSAFKQRSSVPVVNNPDLKYMAKITKYGHIFMMGDQGYTWNNEFTGNAFADEQFEAERWLYLQRLLNENRPNSTNGYDQRRIELLTRYGHKFEMRDVGWNVSRSNEFGDQAILSNGNLDQRWIKLRTKGGMLFQASDIGTDVRNDKLISRSLLQEQGSFSEQEHRYWANRDARWLRLVSRYGYKIVLDDRGSDTSDASGLESPRGNGILLKGRRTPASHTRNAVGDPRGYYWEFNENDEANHTTWGTPMGLAIEMNDRYQYTLITASLGKGWSTKYQGLKENEFLGKPTMIRNPEFTSHHIKLDHENEYVRVKTRGGNGPSPELSQNSSGIANSEIQQGLELRDGILGDGPWVELVDCQHRGLWFSKQHQLGVWRGMRRRRMYQILDDARRKIVIFNNEQNGEIEIYASGNVKVISGNDITLDANRHIFMRCEGQIRMQAGNSKLTLGDRLMTTAPISAPEIRAYLVGAAAGRGAGRPDPAGATVRHVTHYMLPNQLEPTDRGITYNGPFEACPISEIQHTNQ